MSIDYYAMQVGESKQIGSKCQWSGAARDEYNRAQECTRRTGFKFEVDSMPCGMASGRVAYDFTITRKR
jgi:hypothetical protein